MRLMARYLYESQRRLPNRNYAKDHSFDEWYEWMFGSDCEGR